MTSIRKLTCWITIIVLLFAMEGIALGDSFDDHPEDSAQWYDGNLYASDRGLSIHMEPSSRILSDGEKIEVTIRFVGDTDMPEHVTGFDVRIGGGLYSSTFGEFDPHYYNCEIPGSDWRKYISSSAQKIPVYAVVYTTDGNAYRKETFYVHPDSIEKCRKHKWTFHESDDMDIIGYLYCSKCGEIGDTFYLQRKIGLKSLDIKYMGTKTVMLEDDPYIPGLTYNAAMNRFEGEGDFRVKTELDFFGKELYLKDGRLIIENNGKITGISHIECGGLEIKEGGILISESGDINCRNGEVILQKKGKASGLNSINCKKLTTKEDSILIMVGSIYAKDLEGNYGNVDINGTVKGIAGLICESLTVDKKGNVPNVKLLQCKKNLTVRSGKDAPFEIATCYEVPGNINIESSSVVKVGNDSSFYVKSDANIEGVLQLSEKCVFTCGSKLTLKNKTQITAKKVIVRGDLIAETDRISGTAYGNNTVLAQNRNREPYTIAADKIQVDGNVKYKNLSISGTLELTKENAKFQDSTWGKTGSFSGRLSVPKAKVTSLKDGIVYDNLDIKADQITVNGELEITKKAQNELKEKAETFKDVLYDTWHVTWGSQVRENVFGDKTVDLKWEDLYDDIVNDVLPEISLPDESEVKEPDIRSCYKFSGVGMDKSLTELVYDLAEANLVNSGAIEINFFDGNKTTNLTKLETMQYSENITLEYQGQNWHLEGSSFAGTGGVSLVSDNGQSHFLTQTVDIDAVKKELLSIGGKGVQIYQQKCKEALKEIVKEFVVGPVKEEIASAIVDTRQKLNFAVEKALKKLNGGNGEIIVDVIKNARDYSVTVDLATDLYNTYQTFNDDLNNALHGSETVETFYKDLTSKTKTQFDKEEDELYRKYINPDGKKKKK